MPTTRALSLVATGDEVVRDMFYDGHPRPEPGAVRTYRPTRAALVAHAVAPEHRTSPDQRTGRSADREPAEV